MNEEEIKHLMSLMDNSQESRAIIHLANCIIKLENRIEKLESKDFTRNEPLIGGDY